MYYLTLIYDPISLGLNIYIYIDFCILYKMEYENMRVMELRALIRDHGLRNYSQLRRAETVALLQNNPPPAPQMSTWEPIDDRLRPDRPTVQRPRQPSSKNC